MATFFSRLERRVHQVDSLLCVGLDPHPEDLAEQTPQALGDFCRWLIEATADLAAAYKPNTAFFEAYGSSGVSILQEVIDIVPDGIPVILDAKRGDIASTAQAYAKAAFQTLGADAITINPYLGYDAIWPFLEDPRRGVFLLCMTSNPSASNLQDLWVSAGHRVYESVAQQAREWNREGNLGLVVGATQVEALTHVRVIAPDIWVLAPGVGAQGGDLRAALRAGLRPDGMGMLIPVSRGISRADDPHQAAEALRAVINRERALVGERREAEQPGFDPRRASLADGLLKAGCIKFGQFRLKSGLTSPIYIDLRMLAAYPRLLDQVAAAYIPILKELSFDRLAALPYAALPIATAISLQSGWSLVYPRKEVKDYGTGARVEGVYESGEQVVIIDDLATTGGSKFEAVEKLTGVGLKVKDVIVLVDRQSGASEALAEAGYRMHAVFTLTQLLDYWEGNKQVPADQIHAVRMFLEI